MPVPPMNDFDDYKLGGTQVSSLWLNGVKVWPRISEWFAQVDPAATFPPSTLTTVDFSAGFYSSGQDPGSRIYLDNTTDPDWHRVWVDEGIVLRAGVANVGSWTGGTVSWQSDGPTPTGTLQLFLTFTTPDLLDSTNLGYSENIGDDGPGLGYADSFGWASLTSDFTVPAGGGWLSMILNNPTASTLDIQGGALVLEWQ